MAGSLGLFVLALSCILLPGRAHALLASRYDAPASQAGQAPEGTAEGNVSARSEPTRPDARAQESSEPSKSEEETRAPLPEDASGIAVPPRRGARDLVWIPRTILFIPRWTLFLAVHPVRLSLLAYEEFELEELYYRVFWNDARTFGIYPLVAIETGFGPSGGVHLVHRNLFGHREHLRVRTQYGLGFGQSYRLRFHSGEALRAGRVQLRADYRDYPKDRFYGIGNQDLDSGPPSSEPVDPTRAEAAVATSFRHVYARGGVAFFAPLHAGIGVRVSQLWTWRRFTDPDFTDEAPLSERYDTARLVGYDDGLLNAYTELALHLDRRRWAPHVSRATPSSGVHARAWSGYALGFRQDPSNYLRLGTDVQLFVDLFGGDRVLRLRLFLEQVIGARTEIPFIDLPTIGGSVLLRGYPRARFRDRFALASTIEYIYPIDRHLSGFFFVDPGGVWPSFADVDPRQLRMGYGGGLDVHTKRKFLLRLLVASSIDGGFYAKFVFIPTSDLQEL